MCMLELLSEHYVRDPARKVRRVMDVTSQVDRSTRNPGRFSGRRYAA